MHQCLIQWDNDEVEMVHVDNSREVSLADMNMCDANGQQLLSGKDMGDRDHIEETKNRLRLVLSTGLSE